jgi:Tol biopolymer transport system component
MSAAKTRVWRVLGAALALAALAWRWRAAPSSPAAAEAPAAPALFAEGVVSTPDDEFGAAFLPDGSAVYFTKRTPTTNTPPLSFLCVSHRRDGRWQEPEIAPFSGEHDDLGPAVSSDGMRLFFASDRPLPGAKSAAHRDLNIWVVERRGAGWSGPRPLGPTVNTDAEDLSPSVAADGTLYFASTRPGGRGGLDLWRARADGRDFGPAENLGDVNSPGPDGAPAIAPDQSVLVFASSGRPDTLRGRGHLYPRSDLYVSARTGSGFGPPRHLPPPVNTEASESNPSFSPDGRTFYFSSDRGFAAIPMEPAVTADAFAAGLAGVRSGWSNVYAVDARVLRETSP